jgi:hypothetical protein
MYIAVHFSERIYEIQIVKGFQPHSQIIKHIYNVPNSIN